MKKALLLLLIVSVVCVSLLAFFSLRTDKTVDEADSVTDVISGVFLETLLNVSTLSGKECLDGDHPISLSNDINTEFASSWLDYQNSEWGISFSIPYHDSWGGGDCEVSSYKESVTYKGKDVLVFGRPINSPYNTYTMSLKDKYDIKERQNKLIKLHKENDLSPTELSEIEYLNNLIYIHSRVDSSETDCVKGAYVIQGIAHNYALGYKFCGNQDNIKLQEEELIEIISSIKFID